LKELRCKSNAIALPFGGGMEFVAQLSINLRM
jgi:hypothetical protein